MKTQNIIITLLALMLAKAGIASSTFETLGKQWYERRAEGAEGAAAKPNPINQAIAYYEKAMAQSATEENAVALLRCYYFKGSFVPMTAEEQKTVFSKGKSIGEAMTKQFPSSAPVKYWLAAHLGKWAKVNGALSAAKEGVADKIKSLGEEVIKLAPNYNEAGGYEILGLVHLYSPNIPFYLTWPSNKQALENLQKASHLAPTIANNLCLAQAHLKAGNKIMAVALLERTSTMVPREEKLIEDRNGLKQATELLGQLK